MARRASQFNNQGIFKCRSSFDNFLLSRRCIFDIHPLEPTMLKYAIVFAIVSLIAGALGFGGIAAGSAGIAKVLFGLFLILTVVFIVLAALGVGAAKKILK